MKPVIANHLAQCRKQNGLTQEELANQSGVTSRTIQRIESGQVMPQMQTLKLLAKCLNTEPDKLMDTANLTELPTDLPQQEYSGILAAMHIIPLIGVLMPLTNIIAATVFWLFKKEKEKAFDEQGRQILNFQLTISIIGILSLVAMVLYFPVGYPMLMLCYLFAIFLAVYNMIRVLKRKTVYYPLSIRFLKVKK